MFYLNTRTAYELRKHCNVTMFSEESTVLDVRPNFTRNISVQIILFFQDINLHVCNGVHPMAFAAHWVVLDMVGL